MQRQQRALHHVGFSRVCVVDAARAAGLYAAPADVTWKKRSAPPRPAWRPFYIEPRTRCTAPPESSSTKSIERTALVRLGLLCGFACLRRRAGIVHLTHLSRARPSSAPSPLHSIRPCLSSGLLHPRRPSQPCPTSSAAAVGRVSCVFSLGRGLPPQFHPPHARLDCNGGALLRPLIASRRYQVPLLSNHGQTDSRALCCSFSRHVSMTQTPMFSRSFRRYRSGLRADARV